METAKITGNRIREYLEQGKRFDGRHRLRDLGECLFYQITEICMGHKFIDIQICKGEWPISYENCSTYIQREKRQEEQE